MRDGGAGENVSGCAPPTTCRSSVSLKGELSFEISDPLPQPFFSLSRNFLRRVVLLDQQ